MDPVKHERSFALNAHYENLDRPDYHIMAQATVRRLILEDTTAKAVEFQTNISTELFTVEANKEIIMAAGAIHTPKILQVSGIGPKGVLEAAGIETVVDLPGVGQNFQDHVGIVTNITCKYSPVERR